MIDLTDIREVPSLQLRGRLDPARVDAMVEFMSEGGVLPPISVVSEDNLLADGHHRFAAAVRLGARQIDANRSDGGMEDAIAIAIRGNDSRGNLPLTIAQRNEGIARLLAAGWTQERVAEATGLAQPTIAYVASSREAVAAYPSLPIASAIEVAGIGGRARAGRGGGSGNINIDYSPVRDEVASAVKGMEFQQVRQVVRSVNEALRNGVTPDVQGIAESVRPRVRVDTPYEAYEEVKRRFAAFTRPILHNGQMVPIEGVIATIVQNPTAEELRPYIFANEPAAEYLQDACERVINLLTQAITMPDSALVAQE